MKRILVALLLLTTIFSASIVNADIIYSGCPPWGVGNVQPEYSGKIAGYDGWQSSTVMNYDGHNAQVWGLDPDPTRNEQGKIIATGDEQFILFVDGKPVGRCPSDNGANWYDPMTDETGDVVGSWWWHSEDKNRNNKEELDDPNKFDEYLYLYTWANNLLIVWHFSDGVKDETEKYKAAPPQDPLDLPPAANFDRENQSVWYLKNGDGVGGIVIGVDKFGLLAPYIGLASTIMVATVATAIYVKRVKRTKEKQ